MTKDPNNRDPHPSGSSDGKKPYKKPEIRQVKMVLEEALAPGCKTPASNGPSGVFPCLAPQCFNPGS